MAEPKVRSHRPYGPSRADKIVPAGRAAELADNKALVRRYYDGVLTGRDHDLLAGLLDPSFVTHVSGGPDVGADGYMAAVAAPNRFGRLA